MRDSEAVCVEGLMIEHESASNGPMSYERARDFECQCRIDSICTCRRVKRTKERYFDSSRQVYRSQRYTGHGFTDVGVGSVKTVCRRKVRRVYLPVTEETGVGSSDFSFTPRPARNFDGGYYCQRKTSSKCVGGAAEYINIPVVSKKLSPIIKKVSGTTSPTIMNLEKSETISNTEDKLSGENLRIDNKAKEQNNKETNNMLINTSIEIPKDKVNQSAATNVEGKISSDSLIEHVHNLENPSNEKVRSIDLIENKMEREYRKMFTTDKKDSPLKGKQVPELKSASLLRRRFEALRRGLNKKDKQEVVIKISSKLSVPSKKDVSIASDPPSLQSRSYSNTKVYSPNLSISNACDAPTADVSYEKSYPDEKEEPPNWPEDVVDSDCQDVQDMFRLWGKKFNLDDDKVPKNKQKKKVEIILPKDKSNKKEKGKRFLFFKKKGKTKTKETYRQKQGVTAGRCELGDGLTIKIGALNKYTPEPPPVRLDEISRDNFIENEWLQRFMSKKIDSRNSVKIRWNNSLYTTSSSTVFELMDCVYKKSGIIFSSKSEITTAESSNYYLYQHPQVNFMQNIQAWMIPRTILDKPIIKTFCPKKINDHIEITVSNQKWFIDKSKTFAQNIEFVLHSKNLVKSKAESSEYIVIDIPKGYFSDTSSEDKNNNTSDEQVYNIVEYETLNSTPYLNKRKIENKTESGDATKDIQVTVNLRNNEDDEIKICDSNIERRDVVISEEANNGYTPKPCGVISVRIITQRDIRDIKKPILKVTNNIDDKSVHVLPPQKKCELAESFLQDYCRNLTPLGIDILSWCVSKDKLLASSESNSIKSFRNQGDGSKSCSNIYEGYQASTIVSSCETSCSHCKMVMEEENKVDDSKTSRFFSKLIKKTFEPTTLGPERRRVSPKDSFEVFRRRKIYAASNKSKWGVNDDRSEPYFMPEKNVPKNSNECPKVEQNSSHADQNVRKKCKKRVLLQDREVMDEILKEQLSDKIVEGILSFKGTGGCDKCKPKTQPEKQAHVIPQPVCEIPQPPCKESCIKEKKPSCSKKNSPTCNVPTPPPCPVGPPTPCQKPCPPSPPPCRMVSPCAKTPQTESPTRSRLNSSTQCKPIPPRIHSPKLSSPKRSHVCDCPKKRSSCNIPKGPVNKKSSCISTPPCITTPPCLPKTESCDSVSKIRNNSPCKSCEKCKKSSSEEFPWPLKNQQSKTPSKESGLSLKMCPSPQLPEKSSSKCITALKRLIQKVSSASFKQKECRPDCANRRKMATRPCPPAPPPTMPSPPAPANSNKCKMLGLHLKKLPMPKSCSKDCLSGDEAEVIRLNSREKIMIKVKQSTPSTEEIREGCNIKVQDADGQTLYERRDYRKVDRNRMQFVKDMYRESHVQRIATPDTDLVLDKKPLEINECKSDASLSNIIEINLSLKFRQGDKTADVNISKSVDTLSREQENSEMNHHNKSPKEIYVVGDKTKIPSEDADKRDVDIKIMIKNYKAPVKLITSKHSVSLSAADEFSKKISEKFHTVSTGYSDIIEKQTYSIHRTTIDLANSSDTNFLDKPKLDLQNEGILLDINDIENQFINDSTVIEHINKSYIINTNERESQVVIKDNTISQIDSRTSTEKTEITNDKSATSISIANTDDNMNSDATNVESKGKLKYNKEEKKRILKRIFETASEIKKRNNKGEIKEIRQLLRAVLTSDSSDGGICEADNKITEEVSYAAIKPICLKDSNSTTNCDFDKSSMSTKLSSKNDSEEIIYPTKDNSEYSSDTDVQNTGCLCNRIASKLNLKQNIAPCCCRGVAKINEEIYCNIKTDDEFNNIAVETQCSEHENDVTVLPKDVLEKSLDDSSKRATLTQNNTNDSRAKSETSSALDSSERDKKEVENLNLECNTVNLNLETAKSADVLQCNEAKKAVLEIYAQKIITSHGKHVVARLPKFISERESKIYNYQETVIAYRKSDI